MIELWGGLLASLDRVPGAPGPTTRSPRRRAPSERTRARGEWLSAPSETILEPFPVRSQVSAAPAPGRRPATRGSGSRRRSERVVEEADDAPLVAARERLHGLAVARVGDPRRGGRACRLAVGRARLQLG